MQEHKFYADPDVLILVAPHFDVTAVVECLTIFRKRGLSVSLVSNKHTLVKGVNGITFQADVVLAQANNLITTKRQLLVIAGGRESAAMALADPRVHQLAKGILTKNGYVAALSTVYDLIVDTGLLKAECAERFLRQGSMETAVFVQELIRLTTA